MLGWPTVATRAERAKALHRKLLKYERGFWKDGAAHVGGLDEAGAGPGAGPVMAGCVVLDKRTVRHLVGVNDSKKLSHERRVELAVLIKAHAAAWAVAESTTDEIDQINIRQAALLAMRRAFEQVRRTLGSVDQLLIDARELEGIDVPQTSIIKGDSTSLSIAAASILAKVTRDELMLRASETYPEYGFDKHKGYGTEAHQIALERHGVTPLHRRSFAPVRALIEPPVQQDLFDRR